MIGYRGIFGNKLIVFLAIVLIFVSCTNSGSSRRTSGEKKLVLWYWMTDRQQAFEELARKYEQEKGIKVECKLIFPPDIYTQKVIAAARAGNLPDIFGILGEKKILASFIKAGDILDLTPFMQEDNGAWKSRFYKQALDVTAFPQNNIYGVKAGIYGVPIDMMMLQFVYNRHLLKQAGFDPDKPPATIDEFIQTAKVAQDKLGKIGFICGWGESWLLYALCTEWAMNLMGKDKFIATLKGEVPYTDPDWVKVFSLFKKLKDSGILAPNIVTIINKEAEDFFSREDGVFSFDGSWGINVYRQLSPDLDYAFFSLPRVSDKFPVKVWGGAGSSFMVNAHSPLKEEAVNFLKWITQDAQQRYLIKTTNNFPAIKGCEDVFPPRIQELARSLDSLTHPNVWGYEEDSRVIEVIGKGLQQIVMGLKSPEEVVRKIQATKDRIMREK